jgi:hypothetical protein
MPKLEELCGEPVMPMFVACGRIARDLGCGFTVELISRLRRVLMWMPKTLTLYLSVESIGHVVPASDAIASYEALTPMPEALSLTRYAISSPF